MELNAFAAALARRWYLVLVALVLTAGVTYLVVERVGPSYVSKGTVLLFPPKTTIAESDQSVTQGNPYLYLGGLNPARDILIRTMTSTSARDAIEEQYPGAGYEMSSDPGSDGPIIAIEVSGTSAAETLDALGTLLDEVDESLADLQAGLDIDDSAYISSRTLTADERPEVVRKGQIRSGIVAGASVLTLSLLAIGLLDGLVAGRGRNDRTSGTQPVSLLRRRERDGDEPEERDTGDVAVEESQPGQPAPKAGKPGQPAPKEAKPGSADPKPPNKRETRRRPAGSRPGQGGSRGKSPTGS
ncbi:hypothetical protein [Nocardioides sp. LHG3406-4]|uniref:hypothetical protein n=1 Tax=Nocardioides sp. LHG3406-4 TaxID=2804575 RepID=UPI003CF64B5A